MLPEAEKYLVEAIRKGDYHSFEILFRTYYSVLCKYACSYVKVHELAEDIVSEIFVRLWEKPEGLNIEKSLKAYLFRCVRNSCLNFLLRTKQRSAETDPETIKIINDLHCEMLQSDPLDSLLLDELHEKFREAIALLPPECARIFILSRENELSHKEIAQKLNISENTVKVQIYRALLKIREFLKDYLK
ncbi:MAG TPA: RNA polymerase sigma-70 factor [Bacteroidales bacterium]|nr:RNA polymerase sigma-70 factor [Bacteroidales bacterium]